MIMQITPTIAKVTNPHFWEDSQNPLFINQNTGQTVLKQSWYIKTPVREYQTCACGLRLTQETSRTRRFVVVRHYCDCLQHRKTQCPCVFKIQLTPHSTNELAELL